MKMLKYVNLPAMVMGIFFASCAQQPAPIINGYTGTSPLISATSATKAGGPAPLKQEVADTLVKNISPVPNSIPASIDVETIEPAAGPGALPKIQQVTRRELSQIPVAQQIKPAAREIELVQHTIAPTDTVYSVASKYESSASAILKQNGLKATSDIRAGQVIVVPAYSHPKTSLLDQVKQTLKDQPAVVNAEVIAGKSAEVEAQMVSVEPAAGEGADKKPSAEKAFEISLLNHQVQQGETIYRISRIYNSSVLDIMAANEFDTPQQLKYGTIVKVPTHSTLAVTAKLEPSAGPDVSLDSLKSLQTSGVDSVVVSSNESQRPEILKVAHVTTDVVPDSAIEATQQTVIAIKEKPTAALETEEAEQKAAQETIKTAALTATDEMRAELKRGQIDPVAANARGKVWPVKGKILRRFGEEGNGVAYTGINIAVPANTPVLATDQGSVLYADEGLKTYGKLVLIRHKDGTVSAYAHNGHLLVRKGESVKKGQVIAMSGASGNVDSPQLHFELRQHASALDPLKVLPQL